MYLDTVTITFTDVTTWPVNQVARLIQPYAVINVAGNRESKNPGIFETTRITVRGALMLLQMVSK